MPRFLQQTATAVLAKFRINYYRRLEPKTIDQPKRASAAVSTRVLKGVIVFQQSASF